MLERGFKAKLSDWRFGILKGACLRHAQHPLQDQKTWCFPHSRWAQRVETWELQGVLLGTKELEKTKGPRIIFKTYLWKAEFH